MKIDSKRTRMGPGMCSDTSHDSGAPLDTVSDQLSSVWKPEKPKEEGLRKVHGKFLPG